MKPRPMLAAPYDPSLVKWPMLATPKIDGIRCIKWEGEPLTRSGKPIPNRYIRSYLQGMAPNGVDGELVVEGRFGETVSAVMRAEGEPAFTYKVFDFVAPLPYTERVKMVEDLPDLPHLDKVLPLLVTNEQNLQEYENVCISLGFEGVCLRKPSGLYKHGRSTAREGLLLKLKRFQELECVVIGYTQLFHNTNPQEVSPIGYTERSTKRDGLVAEETLGSLMVKDNLGRCFHVGTGLSRLERDELWQSRDSLLGRICTVKFLPHGEKDVPRHPVFKGWRGEVI